MSPVTGTAAAQVSVTGYPLATKLLHWATVVVLAAQLAVGYTLDVDDPGDRLAERLFRWLISENGVETRVAAEALAADWRSDGRRDLPPWLAAHVPAAAGVGPGNPRRSGGQRQARHLRGAPVALHAEERGGSTGSADGSGPRT